MRLAVIILFTPLLLLAQQTVAEVWYFLPHALAVIYYDNISISTLDFVDGTMKYHVQKIANQSAAVAGAYHAHFHFDAKQHEHYLRDVHYSFKALNSWPNVSKALVDIAHSAHKLSQLRNYEMLDLANCYLSTTNLLALNASLPKLRPTKLGYSSWKAVRDFLSIERAQLKECASLTQQIPNFYHDHRESLLPLIDTLRVLLDNIAAEDAGLEQRWASRIDKMPWWKARSSSLIRDIRLDFNSEHSAQISAIDYVKTLIRDFEHAVNTIVPATAVTSEDLEDISRWSVWTELHVAALYVAASEMRTKACWSVEFEERHGIASIDPKKLASHVRAILDREMPQLGGTTSVSADEMMNSYLQTAAVELNRVRSIDESEMGEVDTVVGLPGRDA